MAPSNVALKVVILLIMLTIYAPVSQAEQASVYTQIEELFSTIEYLYGKGVDVTEIIRDLNTVIELADSGNRDEALIRLEQVKRKLRELEHVAEDIYVTRIVAKYALVCFIASIPVLVYTLLPRVYLYLWYKVRRKWLVRW